ncbi:ANTAR domain-containing protein [Nocardioides caricicola]|uniref:ANTAR domain-containing protein n=1 Tax=Nocardioides caricicola TaxID=634770 RepID=A0ABW0MUF3_9ACTN
MSQGDSDALLELHRALGEVVADLADAGGFAHAGRLVADFGVQHLGADIAAVSRHLRRGGLDLVAATDDIGAELVALRVRDPDLPGGRPLAEGEIVQVPRAWHPLAADLGLESALLVGLPQLSSGPAALELYSSEQDAFAKTRSEISRLARVAGTALRFAERRVNLEDALHTHDIIGRAQGLLMERYRLTGDQAMSYLRRHSQQSQQPIRELAAHLVGQHETEAGTAHHGAEAD